MTLRALGRIAKASYSAIAAIEAGRRAVSPEVAERLADALKVEDKGTFMLKAIGTTKRLRVLPFAKNYGTDILNALALYLAYWGIRPENVRHSSFATSLADPESQTMTFVTQALKTSKTRPSIQNGVGRKQLKLSGPKLLLTLKSGEKLILSVSAHIVP